MRRSTAIAFNYTAFAAELKARIQSARLTAARTVNSELVGLYWDIGGAIRDKQSVQGWGDAVVERLARDLKRPSLAPRAFRQPTCGACVSCTRPTLHRNFSHSL